MHTPTSIPHICPETVAIAAPATPRAGNPKRPNIRMGSRAIFTIAPVRPHTIGAIILPVA